MSPRRARKTPQATLSQDGQLVQTHEITAEGLSPRTPQSIMRVIGERRRQINTLGWDADHDAMHTPADWAFIIRRELESIGVDTRPEQAYRVLDKVGAVALAALDALPNHTEYRRRLHEQEAEQIRRDAEEHSRRLEEQRRARQAAAEAEDEERRAQTTELAQLRARVGQLEQQLSNAQQTDRAAISAKARRTTRQR